MINSRLYRSLCKATRQEDHAALLTALEAVKRHLDDRWWWHSAATFNSNASSLVYAFDWHTTPQGFKWWNKYATRMRNAGFKKQAGI